MYLAGIQNEHWKICAGIPGTGSLRIQKDISNQNEYYKDIQGYLS